MPAPSSTTRPTFPEAANIFIPFSFLLSAALLVPETQQQLTHGRVIYTIWVAIIFMIPALWLQLSRASGPRALAYWQLCWSAAWAAYMVHFYFTVGVVFHGSLREVYAAQGPLIATSNLLDTAWWTFDVGLAWLMTAERRWISVQRVAAHTYIAMTFFVSAVVIKHGVVKALGIAMTAAAASAIVLGVVRWLRSRQPRAAGAVAMGSNT
jgi:hypothetical protein